MLLRYIMKRSFEKMINRSSLPRYFKGREGIRTCHIHIVMDMYISPYLPCMTYIKCTYVGVMIIYYISGPVSTRGGYPTQQCGKKPGVTSSSDLKST